jgi:hypothetical protein
MFHPDNSDSSGPLWLGDWKYQIGSSNTCERSRQKHDKNGWEWSHFLGIGMDFQAKEWSVLFRNGLHHIRYAY